MHLHKVTFLNWRSEKLQAWASSKKELNELISSLKKEDCHSFETEGVEFKNDKAGLLALLNQHARHGAACAD